MKKVLIVEDSSLVLKVIKHVIGQTPEIHPLYAEDFKTAKALVEQHDDIFTALVDLSLPDAPNGEVVDFTLSQKISTIVLTGSFDEERRKQLLAKGVLDYVTKEGRFSYEYTLRLILRLIKNEHVQVLVVDDSATSRNLIGHLLRLQHYKVFEAEDGVQAIKILLENPDIRLLITDYNMPRMDGCELVRNLRVKYEKTNLTIIGLSSDGEESLSAKFIKYGANDFLRKPFNQEEFFCRITHNIEMIEMIEVIRDSANRDHQTGVYNRQYFFQQGENLLRQATTNGVPIAAAIIDLDDYNEINMLQGNDAGDYVIRMVANKLMESFERFLFARADGHVFYLLMYGLDNKKATALVGTVRNIINEFTIDVDSTTYNITYSAGVSNQNEESLDGLIRRANECLIRAKEAGGDLVFGDE